MVIEPHNDDTPDDSFGPYEILCEVGRGGMGMVYLAEQTQPVRREVAIKVLRPELDTTAVIRRFETERQALAVMNHSNIAAFCDAGVSGRGRPYFAMEFVEGEPITAAADRHACTIPERLALFIDVCRAIEHAHRRGVVHRDIKPSNILVAEQDGRLVPKVIDFGIARAVTGHLTGETVRTMFGEFLGTPEYASPEQLGLGSGSPGPATDIYSLGVVLYELLSGVLPFDPGRLRESSLAEATRILRDEPAPEPARRLAQSNAVQTVADARKTTPDALLQVLSNDIARLLRQCLEKDPALRYGSPQALADDIDRYLRGDRLRMEGPTSVRRIRRRLLQHRVAVGGLAIAAASAVLATTLLRRTPDITEPVAVRPLTAFSGAEIHPSLSPDGSQVAFSWDGGAGNFDIYVQNVNGGAPVRLTDSAHQELFPAWSPDGRELAFVRIAPGQQSLHTVPVHGRGIRDIAPLSNRDLIWAQNPASLSRKPGPVWSADGSAVIVATATGRDETPSLHSFSLSGMDSRRLTAPEVGTNGDSSPALSPDGRWLAFIRKRSTRGNESIFVLPLEDGPPKEVHSERRGISDIAWLSNSELLFSSNRSGPPMLWRLPVHGGAPELIAGAGRGISFLSFSRAGKRLAFAEQTTVRNLWRLSLHQKGRADAPEKILASSRRTDSPEISPDSSRIAFVSDRQGTRQIWVSGADGLSPVQVSSVAAEVPVGTPRWSPDGRRIVYDTMHNGRSAIAVINADGRERRILAADPWDNMMPSWSKDGQWIYFACNIDGGLQVCRKPIAGGATTPLTSRGGGEPRESLDGRLVFYAKRRGLWQVPRDGGPETPVPGLGDVETGRYWTVSPGAIYLLTRAQPPWTIFRYDLKSGRMSPVFTMPKPPDFGSSGLTVSPDLNWLLFCQIDEQGSDIVVAESIAPR